MFKKSKGGSSFKSGKMSSADAGKKELLEQLGYVFDSVTRKAGWRWSAPEASSGQSFPEPADAVMDAWRDAGERACAALNIPSEIWDRMGDREQAQLIQEALPAP